MKPPVARGASVVERAMRVVRVSTYLTFVLAAAGVVTVARARAAVGDAVLSAGGELAGVPLGPANRVRLNGELVNVSSTMVDEAPAAVLDRIEAECRSHVPLGLGVVRRDAGDRGAVACLARGEGEGRLAILHDAQAMMAAGDLSKLGKLRYVTVERTPGATKTHVVAAWVDGPLRFQAFTPKDGGDTPGSDPEGAPRPFAARRILTANLEGVPYGVRVYDAKAAPGEVFAAYDRDAPAQGWRAIPAVARELEAHKSAGRAFTKDGLDLMIFAAPDRRDPTRTIVSIVETRAEQARARAAEASSAP
jgi:hypothetical protein